MRTWKGTKDTLFLDRQSKDHWQIGNGECESPGTYYLCLKVTNKTHIVCGPTSFVSFPLLKDDWIPGHQRQHLIMWQIFPFRHSTRKLSEGWLQTSSPSIFLKSSLLLVRFISKDTVALSHTVLHNNKIRLQRMYTFWYLQDFLLWSQNVSIFVAGNVIYLL